MDIKLKKAIRHNGEDIKVLNIPLEEVTGNDLIEIEKRLMKSEDIGFVTDFNKTYLINVAASAAHIPVEVLKFMSARDFTKVINEVRVFLAGSDSNDEEEATTPEKLPEMSSVE